MRTARTLAFLSLSALFACGGSTTDDTAHTTTGGGGTAGSGGGTAGTAGTAGKGGTAGSGGSAAGAGGSAAGSGGSAAGSGGTAGAGGSAAGAGGSSAGSGGTAGGAGGSAGNGMGGAAGAPALDTSIDLVLPTVVQSNKPLGASSPTPGVVFRLDLRTAPGGYEAVVTPSFGDPAAMTVALTPTQVVLTGNLVVHGNSQGTNVTDTWTTLTLVRSQSGALTDVVKGVGDEQAFGGDVVDMAKLTADGALEVDTVAPLYQLRRTGLGGPKDAALPWDDFAIRASEPVDGIAKAVTMTEGGKTLATLTDTAPVVWPGTVQTSVLLSSWDVTDGTLGIALAGDVAKDPSGNFAKAFTTTVPVKAVGPAMPQHSLDGDVITVSSWGKASFLGGLVPDPECEMGGCAQLGPLDLGYCSQDEAGIAARLQIDGKSQVAVRFRVLAASQSFVSAPLRLSVTSHDGKGAEAQVMPMLVANSGDFPFASAWATALVPVPPGAKGEVGIVVEAGTSTSCGFVPPAVKGRIVIDRIEAM